MSATLIAVIFALALGHLAPALATSVRQYDWFDVWLRWLNARSGDSGGDADERAGFWRGRYGIALALLPPVLLVGLFQFALHSPLAGVVGLLFGVAVLFHVWGPRDLDADVTAVIDAEDAVARRAAVIRLGAAQSGANADSGLGEAAVMVEGVFASALRRWFGVLFWFLLFGAAGAVLYRLAALAAEGEFADALPASTRDGARRFFALLNWPVAQAMTLSLALVGNFDTVLGVWRDANGASLQLDHAHLGAAARASVRCEIAEETKEFIEEGATPGNAWAQLGDAPELRDAMSLVWRILLLWLAILALFVVAGWVS
jgi:AmpE protein